MGKMTMADEIMDLRSYGRPAEAGLFERPTAPESRMMAQAAPEQRQEQPSDRYGVFAFGTNDYRNPDAALAAARDIHANATSMGMTPVFVLPNASDKRFAPVSDALRQFAEDRGIKYEAPSYDPKDPLHLTRQSAQDIAKRYPDAFVGGDSNSVRLQNWGYGRKLHDSNTYVDPRTGQVLGRVGAPSRDIANWVTQYRKSLERGNFKSGGSAYPLRSHTDWEESLDYEKKGGKLTHMSPAQFLARGPALEMNDRDKRTIAHFEKQIKNGVKMDPVAIKASGKPNGRHRAMAAKNLGIDSIPVVLFPRQGRAMGGSIIDDRDAAAFGGFFKNNYFLPSADRSSPDYYTYYQSLDNMGAIGKIYKRALPDPMRTGAYDAWSKLHQPAAPAASQVKTPEFNFTPANPAQATNQGMASLDWASMAPSYLNMGQQSQGEAQASAPQEQQQAQAPAPQQQAVDSAKDWHSLGANKQRGGPIVDQALMLLSQQAKRQRGRPD